MKIKEKHYIKKCDCGTEIIYTKRDCYHNTTWNRYSLYCPSCNHEYYYRRGMCHDLFDEEYEEDSVDKDKEIESLKHKLEIANNKLNMIKRNVQILTPDKLLEIIENYTGFFGKGSDKE